ncbi:poly [ADP-ribose] polymerase tankyrase-1-like [Periplaneta americana]|uniref:poly [ADP-ribose] polymerase tankyrase-1-like n=1 Tax=Periplaneta americana TaxID=6978 RepID=UPI0037E9630C
MACGQLWLLLTICICARATSECEKDLSQLEKELLSKTKLVREHEEIAGRCQKSLAFLKVDSDRELAKMKKQLEMQESSIAKVSELERSNELLQDELRVSKEVLRSKEEVLKKLEDANRTLTGQVHLLTHKINSCETRVRPTAPPYAPPRTLSPRQYPASPLQRALLSAIKSKDLAGVKSLIQGRVSVNFRDDTKHQLTPLITAALYGNAEAVRQLLRAGANVDDASSSGSTALHHAALGGYLEVCRLLLARGASPDVSNSQHNTPLHLAAARGHLAIVKLLVQNGADVQLRNSAGDTAQDVARKAYNSDISQWLGNHISPA